MTSLAFDIKASRLITGGDDGVKVWNLENGQYVRTVTDHVSSVWRVGCDEQRLVCAVQREAGTMVEVRCSGYSL